MKIPSDGGMPEGELAAVYRKIHMFDVDLDKGESWREASTYAPGEKAVIAELPFGKLGFAICYDLRFPQLFRDEAIAGADILTAPAAFTKQTGEAHWHVLLRARAIENGAFLISAAQAGLQADEDPTGPVQWNCPLQEIDRLKRPCRGRPERPGVPGQADRKHL